MIVNAAIKKITKFNKIIKIIKEVNIIPKLQIEILMFQDKILDFPLKKYDMSDPVFKSVKKEENKMITNFYKSKKR